MFQDYPKINKFLELTGEFSTSHIDEEQDDDMDEFHYFTEQSIANHKIIELKGNFIPKGLVPLERLFLKDDTLAKPTVQYYEESVSSYNIGTEIQLKIIKISKLLTEENKNKYISLLKKFVYIFAWSYEDLKTYDTSIIQHNIPLKPNTKPFRKKLRRINPALLPIIEEVKKLLDAKIIVPLQYSTWVSNMVPIRKKNN